MLEVEKRVWFWTAPGVVLLYSAYIGRGDWDMQNHVTGVADYISSTKLKVMGWLRTASKF